MKFNRYIIVPAWLEVIMGERERAICEHPSAKTSNYDEDYPNNRLPPYQQHIISDIGSFTIDGRRKMIIG